MARCCYYRCRCSFEEGQIIEVFEGKKYHVAHAAIVRQERRERLGQKPATEAVPAWCTFFFGPLLWFWGSWA